jgi:hypothetical protein
MCLEGNFWATSELHHVTYDFAEVKYVEHNSNKSSEQANAEWLVLFLKMNPRIS